LVRESWGKQIPFTAEARRVMRLLGRTLRGGQRKQHKRPSETGGRMKPTTPREVVALPRHNRGSVDF
jgi:hypothetical protein